MRKLLVVTAFLLFAGVASGQTLQKGGSFGLHVLTIELAPDLTMDQYLDFLNNKYIPKVEKHFKGVTVTLMEGDRGEHVNNIGWVNYFESEEARDRYWPEEGESTDEGKAAREKIQPFLDELEKLGTYTREYYTGWVIL